MQTDLLSQITRIKTLALCLDGQKGKKGEEEQKENEEKRKKEKRDKVIGFV